MNLIEPILRHATLQPDVIAIIDSDRSITYGELAPLVLCTASHLAAHGVEAGDRVGVCLKDNGQHLVALLAVSRMGAVVVPIDWRARPAEQERVASALGVKLALVEPESRAGFHCPAVPLDAAWHRGVGTAAPCAESSCEWDAPFHLTSTSGTTTGAPKFLLKTHLQLYFTIAILFDLLSLPRGCRLLSTRPLYFGSARQRIVGHLCRGDGVIVHPPLVTAEEYVALATRHNATVGSIGPPFLRQLLRLSTAGGLLLPGMMALCCGGSPLLAEEKLETAERITPNFFENYSTAAAGVVAMLRPEDIRRRPASVGRPHPLVAVEVVGNDDRRLEPGAVGLLRCRSPALGTGVTGPGGWEAAGEGFRDGWYYPGEYAVIDEDGYVFANGRTVETIMRGNAKIHPPEIETVLCQHEAVAEAAVIGRPAGGDTEIVAFVIGRRPVGGGELLAHCRRHLTPYKVPQRVIVLAEMPRNAAGKIAKSELRRRLDIDATANGDEAVSGGDNRLVI
ncbi:MAG TPA: class I adenylate-forming enzyme family protein [Stellaceae bacterium]|nr:class I adenylate-forming enzyme family protein [Stellaceae bacterium]